MRGEEDRDLLGGPWKRAVGREALGPGAEVAVAVRARRASVSSIAAVTTRSFTSRSRRISPLSAMRRRCCLRRPGRQRRLRRQIDAWASDSDPSRSFCSVAGSVREPLAHLQRAARFGLRTSRQPREPLLGDNRVDAVTPSVPVDRPPSEQDLGGCDRAARPPLRPRSAAPRQRLECVGASSAATTSRSSSAISSNRNMIEVWRGGVTVNPRIRGSACKISQNFSSRRGR